VRGGSASARSGSIPGEITVVPGSARVVDFTVTLRDGAGRDFSYSRFFAPIDWRLKFFDISGAKEPAVPDLALVSTQKPILETTADRIDYLSGRALTPGLPNDHIAMIGEGVVDLPAGRFVLRTISDDGIRVFVDGKLVIDRWDVHESIVDEAPITGGRHTLRVEYFERVSWAELRVEIVKP
jgi:hypothetical protein